MKLLLKYSTISFLILSITKLVIFFTHSQFTGFGIYSGLFSLLLTALPIFFAIKKKRDNFLGGFISFKEVMGIGLGMAIITGIAISTFTFIYYRFIDHETVQILSEKTTALMTKENKSSKEIETQLIALQEFYSPFRQSLGVFSGILVSGLILSFICSTFLIKNPMISEN